LFENYIQEFRDVVGNQFVNEFIEAQNNVNQKEFRFQRKVVHLIYPSHVNKKSLAKQLMDKIGQSKINSLYISHEKEDKDDKYMHTHVAIETKTQIDTTKVDFFDFDSKYEVREPARKKRKLSKEEDKKQFGIIIHPFICGWKIYDKSKSPFENLIKILTKYDKCSLIL